MRSPAPPTPAQERRLAGIALRVAAVTAFAVLAAAIKLSSARDVSLAEIMFARNAFAMPLIVGWIAAGPGRAALRTRRPAAHVIRAALGLGSMALNFGAIILLPLADATAIGFSAPLFATLLSALLLGEAVGPHRWAAVALGFVGVVVVMQPGGSAIPPLGLAMAIVAALGVGTVNITLRQISATEGVATTVFWFTAAGLVVGALLMPFFATAHDPATWGLMIVIGLAGGVAQICLTGSLRLAPVAVVAPFDYVQLLWASLLGWAIWATHPTPHMAAGAALIVASGLYTLYREHLFHRERLPATPPEG